MHNRDDNESSEQWSRWLFSHWACLHSWVWGTGCYRFPLLGETYELCPNKLWLVSSHWPPGANQGSSVEKDSWKVDDMQRGAPESFWGTVMSAIIICRCRMVPWEHVPVQLFFFCGITYIPDRRKKWWVTQGIKNQIKPSKFNNYTVLNMQFIVTTSGANTRESTWLACACAQGHTCTLKRTHVHPKALGATDVLAKRSYVT